ncbi:hypothetical protein WN51_13299 [Melipona quadrifasciata]|uniref:Uncharacterized protein n=1 Tax=Melipona quadrifasciata TaxID=166423 RepID=A0A0N0U5W9_9HYME|nr:hypothetical protein WN51_13299 [Melipona quadrifasciata]
MFTNARLEANHENAWKRNTLKHFFTICNIVQVVRARVERDEIVFSKVCGLNEFSHAEYLGVCPLVVTLCRERVYFIYRKSRNDSELEAEGKPERLLGSPSFGFGKSRVQGGVRRARYSLPSCHLAGPCFSRIREVGAMHQSTVEGFVVSLLRRKCSHVAKVFWRHRPEIFLREIFHGIHFHHGYLLDKGLQDNFPWSSAASVIMFFTSIPLVHCPYFLAISIISQTVELKVTELKECKGYSGRNFRYGVGVREKAIVLGFVSESLPRTHPSVGLDGSDSLPQTLVITKPTKKAAILANCPPNEMWNDCGTACPPTCEDPNPEICTLVSV